MKLRTGKWRRFAGLLAVGCVLQAGSCTLSQDTLSALGDEVITRQAANLLSDAVFFFMDNALVRLTG